MGIEILKKIREVGQIYENRFFKSSGNRLEELYSIKISKGKHLEKIENLAKILNKPQSS